MPVTIAVLGVGSAVLLAISVISKRSAGLGDDVDPRDEEAALVHAASKSHAAVRFVRRTSRNVAGSTLLTLAFVSVLGLSAIAGALLDMIVAGSGVAAVDGAVADWGSRNATASSTAILGIITHLGSSAGAIVVMSILGYTEWRKRGTTSPAVFMAIVYGGHALISNLLKLIVERERPLVEHLVGTVSSSFPSTHSGTAAAVWAAVALVLGAGRSRNARFLLGAGALTITTAVAASRALLGVHWLTDVLAGVAIGWAWFLLVAISFGGRAFRIGEPAERVAQATTMKSAATS